MVNEIFIWMKKNDLMTGRQLIWLYKQIIANRKEGGKDQTTSLCQESFPKKEEEEENLQEKDGSLIICT